MNASGSMLLTVAVGAGNTEIRTYPSDGLTWYMTTVGPYDTVAISEALDDEAISAHLLEISSLGSVRTTALRAYDEEEMSEILRRLG
jgi:uncharacterized protein with GYD domain